MLRDLCTVCHRYMYMIFYVTKNSTKEGKQPDLGVQAKGKITRENRRTRSLDGVRSRECINLVRVSKCTQKLTTRHAVQHTSTLDLARMLLGTPINEVQTFLRLFFQAGMGTRRGEGGGSVSKQKPNQSCSRSFS